MSDPRLEDGARSASTSIKTPGSVIQQFLASLTAACLALDELDIRRLRNNDQYIAKMNRLMVPMFTSPTAGEGDAGGGDTGKKRRQKKGKGTKLDVQTQPPPHAREPPVAPVTLAPANDPPSAPSAPSLSPPTASIPTAVLPQPPKPALEYIRRLGPDDPIPELTLDIQYEIVEKLRAKAVQKDGDGWYLVSVKWWNSWVKACNNAKDPDLQALDIRYTMNPVDNTDLAHSSQNTLRQGLEFLSTLGLIKSLFFIAVPREVWEDCLARWYGPPSHVFIRPFEHNGRFGACVDLYPRSLPPVYDEKVWEIGARWKLVNRLIEQEPVERLIYAVSNKWWTLWRLREDRMPGLDETGPVDNSDLLNEQHGLKKGLPDGSFVRVPMEVWHLLKTWFGTSTPHDTIIVVPGRKSFFR